MASTGEAWRLGRRPELDGVRGLAIAFVVLAHVSLTRTPVLAAFGTTGVTVFFTLSGFLITALLLEEHRETGTVSLLAFYARRARRLFPALAVMLATVGALALVLGERIATISDVLAAAFYVGNWKMTTGALMGEVSITWSLSVEEQFYLLWPLALLLLLRRGSDTAVLAIALIGALASMVASYTLWNHYTGADRVYFGSDTRANALLIGAAVAVVIRRWPGASRPKIAGALLAGVVVLALVQDVETRYLELPVLVALLTGGAILCLARGSYQGWLTARPLTWLGQRSYGLYLWHMLAITLAQELGWAWAPTMAVALVLAFGATVLSWRYVEQPFLRRRRVEATPVLPVAYAGT